MQRKVPATVWTDIEKNILEVDRNRQVVEVVGRVLHGEVDCESVEQLVAKFVLVNMSKEQVELPEL